jgi:hypothetical protein
VTEHGLEADDRHASVDAIAGLLAAAAIVIAVVALVYRPARLAPVAVLISFAAGGMSFRWRKLAGVAVAVSALGFFFGMTIAVLTDHPLF